MNTFGNVLTALSIASAAISCVLPDAANCDEVVVITGRVLRSDSEDLGAVDPKTLVIEAVRPNDPIARLATFTANGRYEIRVPNEASIWTIRYAGTDRHPSRIENVSSVPRNGQDIVNLVDKVLFPLPGPGGYERNLAQLIDYEKLWYDGRVAGMSVDALRRRYGPGLLRLPVLGGQRDYERGALNDLIGQQRNALVKRELFLKKKSEVFRLYCMTLPESRTGFYRTNCQSW